MKVRCHLLALAIATSIGGCSSASPPDPVPNSDAGTNDGDPGTTEIDAAVADVDAGMADVDPDAEIDPGKPASDFGPLCIVQLFDEVSSKTIYFEDCTTSAASNDRNSHVFFLFRQLPEEATRMYVSLVLGTTPIAPGVEASARAGAIETTLRDGRKFSAGDVTRVGAFQFVIDKAGTADPTPDVYYITGTLEATLVDERDPSSKLRLRAGINRDFSL